MKKIYTLLVCFLVGLSLYAQTWTGGGGANTNWSNPANWSGGVSPTTGGNVVFNTNASVAMDPTSINIGSILVTNNARVTLLASYDVNMTLTSTSTTTLALQIDAGSTLADTSAGAGTQFDVIFGSDAKGRVSGTWYFSGVPGSPGGVATFDYPSSKTLSNVVDVYGTMWFSGAAMPSLTPVESYLIFHSGSTFKLDAANRLTPLASWDVNSTILLSTGSVNTTTFKVGNLTVNMPALGANQSLALPNHLEIAGNLSFQNTNGYIASFTSAGGPIYYTVDKDMTVTGNTKLAFINTPADVGNYTLDVKGAFNMSGTSFYLRNASASTFTYPTTLKLAGNLNHSAGTFGNNSSASSTTTELFAIELDGSLNQNISSVTGQILDANNQVTLRLNNPAGATLTTPLSVGKVSWSSGRGALTTTSTNLLTINNSNNDAADPLVVNAPGAATGFVNGPVTRQVGSVGSYLMPTGSGTSYRPVTVSPTVTTSSGFNAQYFSGAYSNLAVQSPLQGVSNAEYWTVAASPAISATVKLSLNGAAVPGASSSQSVVAAAYDGTQAKWVSGGGTLLTPGNSTSGSVTSAARSSFGAFTFGYGVGSTLPVHLVNVDARKTSSRTAVVSWSVSQSSTPSYFEVLKSDDGIHFVQAGVVPGAKFMYDYRFNDNNLGSGTTYYRLNMVDLDGSTTMSKIVAVVNSAKGVVMSSMLPTVVTGSARVNVSSSENIQLQLMITDMNGRIVYRQLAGVAAGSNQEVLLNLQSLAAGAYQVTGYTGGQMIGTIRFVKQ